MLGHCIVGMAMHGMSHRQAYPVACTIRVQFARKRQATLAWAVPKSICLCTLFFTTALANKILCKLEGQHIFVSSCSIMAGGGRIIGSFSANW